MSPAAAFQGGGEVRGPAPGVAGMPCAGGIVDGYWVLEATPETVTVGNRPAFRRGLAVIDGALNTNAGSNLDYPAFVRKGGGRIYSYIYKIISNIQVGELTFCRSSS